MAPIWLCISVILVQIMIYSHIFHVDETDDITFRSPINLKMHKKKCPKTRKITFTLKFYSMKATFDTYMVMCISYFGSNNDLFPYFSC